MFSCFGYNCTSTNNVFSFGNDWMFCYRLLYQPSLRKNKKEICLGERREVHCTEAQFSLARKIRNSLPTTKGKASNSTMAGCQERSGQHSAVTHTKAGAWGIPSLNGFEI